MEAIKHSIKIGILKYGNIASNLSYFSLALTYYYGGRSFAILKNIKSSLGKSVRTTFFA